MSVIGDNDAAQPVSDGDDSQVSYESYKRSVSQAKAARAREKELAQELNALRAEREAEKTAQLAEQQKFKELWEQSEKEKQDVRSQMEGMLKEHTSRRKRDAVAAHIGAVQKPEFLQFINIDNVDLDNPDTVREEANRFRTEYAMVLQSAPAPTHTATAPGSVSMGSRPNKAIKDMSDEELDSLAALMYKQGDF